MPGEGEKGVQETRRENLRTGPFKIYKGWGNRGSKGGSHTEHNPVGARKGLKQVYDRLQKLKGTIGGGGKLQNGGEKDGDQFLV